MLDYAFFDKRKCMMNIQMDNRNIQATMNSPMKKSGICFICSLKD